MCFFRYNLINVICAWAFCGFFFYYFFYFFLCCVIWYWSCIIVQKKLVMVLIYMRKNRLFIYNRLIVVFNVYHVNWNCVFYITFAISVNSQLILFNCNSVLSLLSIPGGSGWVSSVDCICFICLWCLGVLLL